MNLIEYRRTGVSIGTTAQQIKSNLSALYTVRHMYLNVYNKERYESYINRYKRVGNDLARAIIDDDCSDALALVNQNRSIFNDPVGVLEEKFSSEFFCCSDCSTIDYRDDSCNVENDYSVCRSCCDDRYYWSSRRGYYTSRSEEDDLDHIGEYHSSLDGLCHIPSLFDQRHSKVFLGLELEMEIDEDLCRDDIAGDLLNKIGRYRDEGDNTYQYALCEQDGSLDHGFEMVTSWSGLDVHEKQLAFFKNRLPGARSHNAQTCGLHIHIDKENMSILHASKIILFINDDKNRELIKSLARRD